MARRAPRLRPAAAVRHLVGGQDEVVFDGASFAVDAGATWWRARRCLRRAPALRRVDDGLSGPRRRAARRPRPRSGGAGHRRARLRGQERLPRRHHRPVRWHRFGAGAGAWPSTRWAPTGARGDDALALHRRHLVDRRARHGATRLGVRYDEIRIDGRCSRPFAARWRPCSPAAEDTTEENLQARIRGTLLMALSNKFGHRADHRQQERDGGRLLHAVRRHGGRLCRHQGRGQDPGLPAGALAQCGR
jgi:NAD+ synthase (glutamine-hydrolysing)